MNSKFPGGDAEGKPRREYISRSLSFWMGRPWPGDEYLLALPATEGCMGMYGDVRGMGGGL